MFSSYSNVLLTKKKVFKEAPNSILGASWKDFIENSNVHKEKKVRIMVFCFTIYNCWLEFKSARITRLMALCVAILTFVMFYSIATSPSNFFDPHFRKKKIQLKLVSFFSLRVVVGRTPISYHTCNVCFSSKHTLLPIANNLLPWTIPPWKGIHTQGLEIRLRKLVVLTFEYSSKIPLRKILFFLMCVYIYTHTPHSHMYLQ